MNEAAYLYGFVPAGASLPAGGLAGIAERPVELLDAGAVQVVASRLPAEPYGSAALQDRLRDLSWVAAHGVRHEQVIAWFVDHAQILPARLLSLYSSFAALLEDASARAAEIERQLGRFRSLREWDLKVSYDARRLAERLDSLSPEIAALDGGIAAAAPGRRFLLEKKRAALAGAEVARAARRLGAELLDELAAMAEQVVTLRSPPVDAELPVVLFGALLVRADREADLAALAGRRAAELASSGLTMQYSGPWAPYRFLGSNDDGFAGDVARDAR